MAEAQQTNPADSDNNDYQNYLTNPAFKYAKANDIPIFTFTLNNQNMSQLNVPGLGRFDAFSGQKDGRNNPNMTNIEDIGPLPKGTYYIVKRSPYPFTLSNAHGLNSWITQEGQTIVTFGKNILRYLFTSEDPIAYKSDWFALYRDDNDGIDDKTILHLSNGQNIIRSTIRLHPLGPRGISEGCITLQHQDDFYKIRQYLLNNKEYIIPGVNKKHITAYGIIVVQ